MNRRELFAGAGAAALATAVPGLAEDYSGRYGVDYSSPSTSIWVLSRGDGSPLEVLELPVRAPKTFEGLKPRFNTDAGPRDERTVIVWKDFGPTRHW